MVRNCKLRCAAQTQCQTEKREFAYWDEYPASKSEKLVTPTNLSRKKGLTGRHFKKPAFSISEREKHSCSRLVAALIALALGGGVLASNLINLEKPDSRFADGVNALFLSTPYPTRVRSVEIASLAPVDLRNYGPRRENAQSSRELGSSSIHYRVSAEKLVATAVPAYLIKTEIHPSDTRAAFAPKGEVAHEYWRAMIGASHVIERYQLYLDSHPSGIVADTAVDRIGKLEQAGEKATSTKIKQRVAKAKKSQSTAKQTKPEAVQTAVALPVKETNAIQCGDQNSIKCRKPLQTLAKDCSSTGLSPEGVCIRKNYRTSTVIKR